MKLKVTKQALTRIILFLTIVGLIAVSFLSYQKIDGLIESSTRIQRVQDIRNNLELIFSTVKDAETSNRGFLLTGDSTFLHRFFTADERLLTLRIQFDSLVASNPIQERRMDTLIMLINQKFKLMSRLIEMNDELIKSNYKSEITQAIREGEQTKQDIREVLNRMQLYETEMFRLYREEKEKLTTLTPIFLLMLSILAITLLVISYYAIVNELSKRQEFEILLRKKIEELNHSNTELEQFAYAASHDLQEPLRKIRTFGERLLLKQGSALSEEGIGNIKRMQNSAERMQLLIDDLLEFSRLASATGKMEVRDMTGLLREVLADLEITIKQKNATIIFGTLPVMKIVPFMIRQLFQNLIENALKFSRPDEDPVLEITYTKVKGRNIPDLPNSSSNDQFYKIDFKDNGIGFNEEYSERIFVIFQRLNGKSEYRGTGIGLAICKKIMTIHDGYIKASAKPGKGAIFSLYFPLK